MCHQGAGFHKVGGEKVKKLQKKQFLLLHSDSGKGIMGTVWVYAHFCDLKLTIFYSFEEMREDCGR